MLNPTDSVTGQGLSDHGDPVGGRIFDCLGSGSSAERAALRPRPPPWVADLQKHVEETLQVHLSRQEALMQACLEKIAEWHSQEERRHKLDHKAKERRVAGAASASAAASEPKALEGEEAREILMEFDDGSNMNPSENQPDLLLVIKAVQQAIAPMQADLSRCIERQQEWDNEHIRKVGSMASIEGTPTTPRTRSKSDDEIEADKNHDVSFCEDLEKGRKSTTSMASSMKQSKTNRLALRIRKMGSQTGPEHNGCCARMQRRLHNCSSTLVGLMDWWATLEEPPREGRLAHFTNSQGFESLCAAVIMVNAVFTLCTTNWEIENLGEDPTLLMVLGEAFFLGFYCVELLMKLTVHRFFFLFRRRSELEYI